MVERLGTNYIETFTGKRFWPLNPIWEDIDIIDIAHALSNKCRYTGHTRWFYSVAQHSHLMSYHVPRHYALEALLHDACEAYLPDLAFPIRGAFDGFAEAEERVHRAVAERFNLIFPWPKEVKDVDRRITRDEARTLMKTQGRYWPGSTVSLGIQIVERAPREVERSFLDRYDRLTRERKVEDPWHFDIGRTNVQ
jgi:hypothetical protein